MADKPKFASGGVIKGAGSLTDDIIPLFISRECVVVSPSMAKKYGRKILDRINGGSADIFVADEVLAAYEDDSPES